MNLISIRPINGRYEMLIDWVGKIPSGYVETTVEPEEFYETDRFIIPTIEDGKVVSIAPNEAARAEWKSTQPEQIRADIDFIAAMQGVSL